VKPIIPAIILALVFLQGCHSQPASSNGTGIGNANLINLTPTIPPAVAEDDVIATVRGDAITRKDLDPVLMEGYGLNVLLTLVQLDLVEQEAARQHVIVTPEDVANERAMTMRNLQRATQEMDSNGQPTTQPDVLTPEQEEQLLDQLLQQQHVSRAEFSVILEVNAYLRKIAEPKVNANITEEAIHKQFNAMYGEKVVVHYIVCNNMSEVADVRRALAQGQSFEDVARLRSRDRQTAAIGGELPPFTLADNRFPEEFKQVAFNLKVGEISDPVQIGRFIYIAKLVDRIPPAEAKYVDYRDSVKKELYDSTVQAAMKAMRDRLGTMAIDSLHIRDPILAQQWADRIDNKANQIQDQTQLRQELDREHAAQSSAAPATQPDVAQPPATMPVTTP
jgi:foldase protein PrsA